MPLDPKKIKETHKEISEHFFKKSELHDILNLREYDDKIDLRKKFIEIGFRPLIDKHCLTSTSWNCKVIWQGIADTIVSGEYRHLNKIIAENEDIEKLKLTNLDTDEIYKKIISAVENINGNPGLLLLPIEILCQFELESLNSGSSVYNKIVYNGYTSLLINRRKLRIMSSKHFNDIVILDSKSISWIFKPDFRTNERILVDISNYDLSHADITAKTVVNVEITDPNIIKIIEIPPSEEN